MRISTVAPARSRRVHNSAAASGCARSTASQAAWIPNSDSSSAETCFNRAASRATRTSEQPPAARRRASSSPIPDDAPVTSAVSMTRSGYIFAAWVDALGRFVQAPKHVSPSPPRPRRRLDRVRGERCSQFIQDSTSRHDVRCAGSAEGASMGRVVWAEYVSVDGVVDNPTWTGSFWNDEIANLQKEQLFRSDALLLGRVTYEAFAASWPAMSDPDGFADRMNRLPKYVASRSLKEATWNATVIRGDVVDAVSRL